jgi:hypothetical protein
MELKRVYAVVRCKLKGVLKHIVQWLMTKFNAYENFFFSWLESLNVEKERTFQSVSW